MKHLRAAYFIVANTAIVLLLIQAGTDIALRAYIHVVLRPVDSGPSEAARRNYAHMEPRDRDDLLRARKALRFQYAPVLGLMQAPTTSRFVNVDAWFLGGSTTFGDGVADYETIPAQLERVTRRPVVNLGVRGYSSTEENLLFNHYLRIGYRPALAIFLDGINETCVPDLYLEEMNLLVARAQRGYTWDIGGPLTYAYQGISRTLKRFMGFAVIAPDRQSLTCTQDGRRNALSTIHGRTLAERAALCRLYEIDCRTQVQPFAGLHGRHDELETAFLDGEVQDLRELFGHLEANWRAAGAIFVTDALDQYDVHAYIDEVHYSANASRLIAVAIADRLGLRGSR